MKILLIYICCLALPALAISQDTYTTEDKAKFVHTYMGLKNSKRQEPAALDSLLKVHNISPNRYKSLLINAVQQGEITLTANEIAFKKAVHETTARLQRRAVEAAHPNDVPSLGTYYDMLHRYKTDIDFQHELRPVFLAYFKQNR